MNEKINNDERLQSQATAVSRGSESTNEPVLNENADVSAAPGSVNPVSHDPGATPLASEQRLPLERQEVDATGPSDLGDQDPAADTEEQLPPLKTYTSLKDLEIEFMNKLEDLKALFVPAFKDNSGEWLDKPRRARVEYLDEVVYPAYKEILDTIGQVTVEGEEILVMTKVNEDKQPGEPESWATEINARLWETGQVWFEEQLEGLAAMEYKPGNLLSGLDIAIMLFKRAIAKPECPVEKALING